MILIPAIDMQSGKCVRLRQGVFENETVFSDDIISMAGHWYQQGARRLHLVDLDGARLGRPVHGEAIKAIRENLLDMEIQVGGGIRSAESVEAYLELGVNYIIIGTWATQAVDTITELAHQYPGKIILGLDAKHDKVQTEGWVDDSGLDLFTLAKQYQSAPVAGIIYTDITKDGMMQGFNYESSLALAEATQLPVIVSGGVSSYDDIKMLVAHKTDFAGAILGRALYEEAIDYQTAVSMV